MESNGHSISVDFSIRHHGLVLPSFTKGSARVVILPPLVPRGAEPEERERLSQRGRGSLGRQVRVGVSMVQVGGDGNRWRRWVAGEKIVGLENLKEISEGICHG